MVGGATHKRREVGGGENSSFTEDGRVDTDTGRERSGGTNNSSRNDGEVVVDVCTEGRREGGGVGKWQGR